MSGVSETPAVSVYVDCPICGHTFCFNPVHTTDIEGRLFAVCPVCYVEVRREENRLDAESVLDGGRAYLTEEREAIERDLIEYGIRWGD